MKKTRFLSILFLFLFLPMVGTAKTPALTKEPGHAVSVKGNFEKGSEIWKMLNCDSQIKLRNEMKTLHREIVLDDRFSLLVPETKNQDEDLKQYFRLYHQSPGLTTCLHLMGETKKLLDCSSMELAKFKKLIQTVKVPFKNSAYDPFRNHFLSLFENTTTLTANMLDEWEKIKSSGKYKTFDAVAFENHSFLLSAPSVLEEDDWRVPLQSEPNNSINNRWIMGLRSRGSENGELELSFAACNYFSFVIQESEGEETLGPATLLNIAKQWRASGKKTEANRLAEIVMKNYKNEGWSGGDGYGSYSNMAEEFLNQEKCALRTKDKKISSTSEFVVALQKAMREKSDSALIDLCMCRSIDMAGGQGSVTISVAQAVKELRDNKSEILAGPVKIEEKYILFKTLRIYLDKSFEIETLWYKRADE
jgi:hypothetical protein